MALELASFELEKLADEDTIARQLSAGPTTPITPSAAESQTQLDDDLSFGASSMFSNVTTIAQQLSANTTTPTSPPPPPSAAESQTQLDDDFSFGASSLFSNATASTSQTSLGNFDTLDQTLVSETQLEHLLKSSHQVQAPPKLAGEEGGVESIQAFTFDGREIRLRRRSPHQRQKTNIPSRTANLLQEPMHRLMERVGKLRQIKKTSSTEVTMISNADERLWVDRYKPKKFTDLLGDERVNRETLGWVKEWDYCVFGNQKAKRRKRPRDDDDSYQDDHCRPRERILLLSGPPGLGKTTLAHVIARQAGYSVLEINASDARTGSVVDDRIRPAIEAGSAIGGKKPVLVVIDEIDGATGAGDNTGNFVQKLIELTYDKPKRKGPKKKGNSDGKRPLLRPIICICNDLYAASLARLRPISKIIRCQRASDVLLTKRLRDICEFESLRIDSHALGTLIRVAQGDIRACINALQYLNSKAYSTTEGPKGKNDTKGSITEPMLRDAVAGMKESESSLTDALNALFSPPTRKKAIRLGLVENDDSDSTRYVERLSRILDSTSALERVALGCFEHSAKLCHLHDLNKFQKAHQWLSSFDEFTASVHGDREYAIMPYLSYSLIPFYTFFAEKGAVEVERPKVDWENREAIKANEEIYKSLKSCLQSSAKPRASPTDTSEDTGSLANVRHLLGTPILQLEFAPMLNRIICPQLHPVNRQVIKGDERAMLEHAVAVMSSLNIHFVIERDDNAQLTYRIEPPIDNFVIYDGKRAADMPPPKFAVRQVIANRMEEVATLQRSEALDNWDRVRRGQQMQLPEREQMDEAARENHDDEPSGKLMMAEMRDFNSKVSRGLRGAKRMKFEDKPPVDFFGRPIVRPQAPVAPVENKEKESDAIIKIKEKTFKVTYRFNEGNLAAVRRPIKLSALL